MRVRAVRRFVAVTMSAAFALATVSPGAAAPQPGPEGPVGVRGGGSSDGPPPSRDGYGHPQRGHGVTGGEVVAGAIIFGTITCLIFCNKHHEPGETRRPDDHDDAPDRPDLLNNGPHVSATQPEGVYAVYGFVKAGWPVVIDYDAAPGSRVTVTVGVNGHKYWNAKLESGHHLWTTTYTGSDGGGQATPALFLVQAVSADDPKQPARLDILGIGAGPDALARGAASPVAAACAPGDAVGIDSLVFAPSATRRVGGDFAEFRYHTASLFSSVSMEILHYGKAEDRGGRQVIPVDIARIYGERLLPAGPYGPKVWDGLDSASAPSHGRHRMQVRGWQVKGAESWVVAQTNHDLLAP
jgi:hypothetical protein